MSAELEYRLRAGEDVYVLRKGELLIGRDPDCQVRLDEDLVSRRHARLTVEGDRLMFEDLGSSNGSRVNGVPVEGPTSLRRGDRIRIGLTELAVDAMLRQKIAAPTLRLRHCRACGRVMAMDMTFCVQCGHRVTKDDAEAEGTPRVCRTCGRNVPSGARFCPECGTEA